MLIGTQSWNFRDWVGSFYPAGTRASDMLGFYGRVFSTIEVDATFYGIPAEPVLRDWADKVPPAFRFALKVPQQVTHEMRLVGADEIVARFLERVRVLGDRLGPLLIQLGPDYLPSAEHREVVGAFAEGLPTDVRWAMEFRHPGWFAPEVLETLGRCGIAVALADGRWHATDRLMDLARRPTADFVYLRWMGPGRYLTDYSAAQVDRSADLEAWAETIRAIPKRVEVFGYFNNQFQGHSPFSALELRRLLGERVVDPSALHPQTELF